ncbi:MAG: DNA polymerase III subunit beta [Lachnospiraceae bacterium]|nr:DNA polymerase III subunit beta [Lachnospiraceae bacterium]
MKLIFKKEKIMNAINIVSRAIPARTTNPILECILFDASSEIKLVANDMDLGIETVVEGEIKEKGKVALDAKLITEIIRKADSNESLIEIESDSSFLTVIKADNSLFRIQGRDGEEFPYLPYIEKNNYISISQFTLKEVVRQTIFSAAVNDNNRMMGGEYIEVKSDKVRFTTLDGHRISIRNINMKEYYGEEKAIVPVRSLNEISKIVSGDNEKEIIIFFSKNHLLFEFDQTKVICGIIDGEYFKIDHMLSKDSETKITINKNELISYIDRSMIFIRENDHKPIILNINESNLNISIKSSFGTMDGDILCHKEGKNLKIAFNPKFLIDALRAIDDEEVDLYFTNAKSPCFIRDDEERYIYLILPVNFIE